MISKKLREKINNEIKRAESELIKTKEEYYKAYIHGLKNVLIWDESLFNNRSTKINKQGERVRK